jgi:hypothetical protein
VCAEQVNAGNGVPLFLQIGGLNGSPSNTQAVISWDQPGNIFPGIGSPRPLFTSLTNLFGPGPVSPDTYRAASGKAVLDLVRHDLDSLMRVDMSLSDKKKLSDWADLLRDTGKTVATQCSADTATKLGLTSDRVQAASASVPPVDLSVIAPVMLDLAVLSALCDVSRVIFMKMPPSWVFNFLGLKTESSSLSHRNGGGLSGMCITGVIDMIQQIDSWYAQQFAYLVGRLDSFMEGDRTLLDSSATVWFQEMSDGRAHNLNNLPILQAGSCGGYFKVGQAVNVEGGKTDLTRGHSDEDCAGGQASADEDAVGTPPDVATQPINKFYCNLMNAIGVKAGADGFPAKGGDQPVTKYGKYDDTTLFGTDTPAIIKDPGEYAVLRAT